MATLRIQLSEVDLKTFQKISGIGFSKVDPAFELNGECSTLPLVIEDIELEAEMHEDDAENMSLNTPNPELAVKECV